MRRSQQLLIALLLLLFAPAARGQRMLTDMLDTSTGMGKGMLSLYERYNQIRLGVYLQPQFQLATSPGARGYSGGDFLPNANSRFMLRRGRLRADYVRTNALGQPLVHFVFQTDATERGVVVRDCWGRFLETRWQLFSVTGGIFARPFGYEVNLSSSDREAPERGRMSQILMRTERDVGAMLRFEPAASRRLGWLRVDLGVFNGQGLAGTADYDSHKDIIGRIYVRERKLPLGGARLSGGISGYSGGIVSQSQVLYKDGMENGVRIMRRDSSADNYHRLAPRRYAGADAQLRIPNRRGATEFRAEYIRGQQTATAATSETPGAYPASGSTPLPLYTRPFDGAYFVFLQHLGSLQHQLVIKYDWYDPNTSVRGESLQASSGHTGADVRFSTLGAGYIYYINSNVKAIFWYDRVWNEKTKLAGFTGELEDDVLTVRLQFRF